jgi:microcystin degradation protein MlrC
VTFGIEYLSDVKYVFDGPMMRGIHVDVSSTACVRINDVRVAVSSFEAPMNTRNLLRTAAFSPRE